MQNKTPYNQKGQRHGHWKVYYPSGQLSYKGNYINGQRNGCWEFYAITYKHYYAT